MGSKLGVSITISIPITEGQLEQLHKIAKKRKRSTTLLAREAIKEFLKHNPVEKTLHEK